MVTMPSQEVIADLADRIEIAYSRRNPDWRAFRAAKGVWEAAATGLLLHQQNDPSIPIDPEFFVAIQPLQTWSDPWAELTQKSALARYGREIRRIVVLLRSEINDEVRRVEKKVRLGASVTTVLAKSGGTLSPLGRYVIARRAGLDGLAERLRPSAERQHRSCPLYQQACRSLIPDDLYPLPRSSDLLPGLVIPTGVDLPCFSRN